MGASAAGALLSLACCGGTGDVQLMIVAIPGKGAGLPIDGGGACAADQHIPIDRAIKRRKDGVAVDGGVDSHARAIGFHLDRIGLAEQLLAV